MVSVYLQLYLQFIRIICDDLRLKNTICSYVMVKNGYDLANLHIIEFKSVVILTTKLPNCQTSRNQISVINCRGINCRGINFRGINCRGINCRVAHPIRIIQIKSKCVSEPGFLPPFFKKLIFCIQICLFK